MMQHCESSTICHPVGAYHSVTIAVEASFFLQIRTPFVPVLHSVSQLLSGTVMTAVAGDLVRKIREQLRARSPTAVSDFVSVFRAADRDGSGSLNSREFDGALRTAGLFLGLYDISSLQKRFAGIARHSKILSLISAPGSDGRIQISGFVGAVVGELSDARRQVVRDIFALLDRSGRGAIPYSMLRTQYVASRHPDVERGARTESAVTQEFNATFRTATGVAEAGAVTVSDFEHYHEFLSASFPSDELFVRLVRRVWNTDSAAGTQPVAAGAATLGASGTGTATGASSLAATSTQSTVSLSTVIAVLRDKLMQRTSGSESISLVLARAFRFVRVVLLSAFYY